MSFLSPLMEKSWEPNGTPQSQYLGREHTRKAGLQVLLVVVSVLFFLFVVAFLMRSQYPDWQALAEETSHPLFDKSTLLLNTLYLFLGSVFLQSARVASPKKNPLFLKLSFLLAGLLAAAFITGQLMFWQQLYQQGFTVNSNPALSFFYIFTGLHVAHVGIGILAWLGTLAAMIKDSPKLRQYVELCSIYWHFLFGLWIVLFALLISKPETYKAIVAFCGLGG